MSVLDQLAAAFEEFFDAAATSNDKARDATRDFVTKIKKGDADLGFDLKGPLSVKLPEVDLPDPLKAVDAYFGFIGEGIELNRKFAKQLIDLVSDGDSSVVEATAEVTPKKPALKQTAAKKPAAKKSTAKETAAKKTAAKKTTAKKSAPKKAAKKSTPKKAAAKKTAAKKSTPKKTTAKKSAPKKAAAKKSTAKKTPGKKS